MSLANDESKDMELAKECQRLESVLENSGICSWKWFPLQERVEYSRGWKTLLGIEYLEEHLSGWKNKLHPDDKERVLKLFHEFYANKTDRYESIHRLRHANGDWIWVLSKGWVESRDAEGRILLTVGTTLNISKQKVIEQKLLENQQKVLALFEGSHDATIVTKVDGTFLDCNQKTLELFQFTDKEEFLKFLPSDLSPKYQPDGQTSEFKARNEIQVGFLRGFNCFDWIHTKKNGEDFPAEVLLSAFTFNGEKLLHASIRDISKRKKLELLTTDLQHMAKIGAWELEVDSKITSCTRQIHEICGLKSSDAGILTLEDGLQFYMPHEKDRIAGLIESCSKSGSPFDDEFEFLDARGVHKWVRVKGEAVFNKSGKIFMVKGTIQDVTEKKLMQLQTQRKNEELLRIEEAIDQNVSIIRMDPAGIISYVNDNFVKKSQYDKDEVMGKKLIDICSEDEARLLEQEIWPNIRRPASIRCQLKSRTKDGSVYWNDSTFAPVVEAGTLKEVICFRFDITVEKRALQLQSAFAYLRKKHKELSGNKQELLQSVLSIVLEISESRRGFIGEFQREKMNSEDLEICVSTDDNFSVSKFANRHDDPLIVNRPLRYLNVECYLSIPIIHKGRYVGLFGLADKKFGYRQEDIDFLSPLVDVIGEILNSFKLEEELQLQTRLNHHNSKLVMIGELAAGVGHEINNPLVIIQGFQKIISEEISKLGIDTEIPGYLKNIEVAANRVANIVKGLKTFSRTDSIALGVFDLVDLVHECCFMLKQIYKTSDVDLVLETEQTESFVVYGNRGRIQQVIMNLISNAKDATEDQEPRMINVKIESIGEEVIVSVQDNGCGVPESLREKIFEPFYTTKEVHKGTGMGLSLSSSIIREHQGQLGFQNLTKGARFQFSLPIWKEAVGNEEKIIVLETDPELRRSLELYFKETGAEILIFSTEREAFAEWEKTGAGLVITDSVTLLEAIRSRASHPQPKFIITFAGTGREFCDGVLLKPFFPAQLEELILNVFVNEGT